jgi:hypothetical protein
MPNPWILLGSVVLGIALFLGGYAKGASDNYKSHQIELAKQKDAARQREQDLQGEVDAITRQSKERQEAIQSRLDTALDGLRKRPNRLPEDSRSACKGATGAELSAEDGVFLSREAARADKLREALNVCYQHLDNIRGQ